MGHICLDSQTQYFRPAGTIDSRFLVLISSYHRKDLREKLVWHYQESSFALEVFLCRHVPSSSPIYFKPDSVLGSNPLESFQAISIVDGKQVLTTAEAGGSEI